MYLNLIKCVLVCHWQGHVRTCLFISWDHHKKVSILSLSCLPFLIIKTLLSRQPAVHSLTLCVPLSVVTGWTCTWRARLCLELCNAGTAASRTASVTTAVIALHLVHVHCISSTAAHGLTATLHALRSGIRWRDRKWASSSFSLIWALMYSAWHNNRAWRLARY